MNVLQQNKKYEHCKAKNVDTRGEANIKWQQKHKKQSTNGPKA